nr:hypothetical protein [Ramlibacter rhizophilus]
MRAACRENFQHLLAFRAPAADGGKGMEHHASAQRAPGRRVAQDEAVAVQCRQRLVDHQLGPGTLAGDQPLAGDRQHPCHDVAAAVVQMHAGRRTGHVRPGQQAQPHIEPRGRPVDRVGDEPVAAVDVAQRDIRQVDRAALSRPHAGHFTGMHVQAPYPGGHGARRDEQAVAGGRLPAEDGAGDHRATALHAERAVDGKAEMPPGLPARLHRLGGGAQERTDGFDALAGHRGGFDNVQALQGRAGDERFDLGAHLQPPRWFDPVDLGHHRQASGHTEEVEDLHVLDGLGHDAVVGGDHQQREIDAADAGDHVAHESLMAGHVDESDQRSPGRRTVGETQVDRDPAGLFLRQPVGVDAGQGAHQQRLAMVDMAGSGDDHDPERAAVEVRPR